jgi:hypothetical protein
MCIQDQPYHLLPTPMILSCSLDYLRRDLDIGLAKLIILLIPDSLCWMAANSESFVKDSGTSHPVIRWCDCSLLVITTKRSRGYIDSPFRQVMR